MAFPSDPLSAIVQLQLDGVWTDVTTDVFDRDGAGIDVSRGRTDEFTTVAASTCRLALKDTSGKYSPRNPSSQYYGQIGLNTPLRFSIGTEHLGDTNASASATTSHVAPSITATASGLLISSWLADTVINYTVPGSMTGGTELDGTYTTTQSAYESISSGATGTRTATASASSGYVAVSAVLHGTITVQESLASVVGGASPADITLTTSASTEAGWWMIAIHAWDFDLNEEMPDAPDGTSGGGWVPLADTGAYYISAAEVPRMRAWIKPVKFAGAQSVVFRSPSLAPNLAPDNHARIYVVSGVTDWTVRASGEISSWPPRWDKSGNDQFTPIVASGVLRRVGQGASPLNSAMRRAISRSPILSSSSVLPAAYWPAEDESGSTSVASGVSTGTPMEVVGGTVDWAAYTSVAAGSSPLPDMRTSTGSVRGLVAGVDGANGWTVGFEISYTATNSWEAVRIHLNGTIYDYIRVTFGSTITVTGVNSSGTTDEVTDSTNLSDGATYWITLQSNVLSGSVYYYLTINEGSPNSSTGTTATVAGAMRAIEGLPRSSGDPAGLGHYAAWNLYGTFGRSVANAVDGYAGEVAARRVMRLGNEEGIPVHVVGDADVSTIMGPQRQAELAALWQDCADADGGLLYEPREVVGIAYRTRSTLYSQSTAVTLDYSAGEVASIEPTDDDQQRRNLVVAARYDGSSATAEDTASALSTSTIGTYDAQVDLNVLFDSQLPNIASWLVHLGTVNEYRYPSIGMYLHGSPSLISSWEVADIGDVLDITNPPGDVPPDAISQIIQGSTERYRSYEWHVAANCSPASPWIVGIYAAAGESPAVDEPKRFCPYDSRTSASFVAGTDTTLSVTDQTGGLDLWSTSAVTPFDLFVAGCRLRVTAVGSPSGANQNLTVSATVVNGVAKTISTNTPVYLWRPAIYAL